MQEYKYEAIQKYESANIIKIQKSKFFLTYKHGLGLKAFAFFV